MDGEIIAGYELFIAALTGRYLQAVAPGTTVTPRSISAVVMSATEMKSVFMGSVGLRMREAVQRAERVAPSRVDKIEMLMHSAVVEINRIALSNIATVDLDMRAGRKSLAVMMGGAHGAMGELVQRSVAAPNYNTVDRAGRRWDSKKLLQFVVRDFFYQLGIETELGRMVSEGKDLAQIVYDDPTHAGHGIAFSISGTAESFPSFDSIRSFYFHPNASAKVVPYA